MKILDYFQYLWVIFALLDPDPGAPGPPEYPPDIPVAAGRQLEQRGGAGQLTGERVPQVLQNITQIYL
jgi:hypothetical protein